MKHLVIAPHADDEAFGMGGTIAKLTQLGHQVHIVVVCAGDSFGFYHLGGSSVPRETRIEELTSTANLLGATYEVLPFTEESIMDTVPIRSVVSALEGVQKVFQADRWYVAGPSFHQDHRVVFEAAMSAARVSWQHAPKDVYAYELPMYSMNHRPWEFKPNVWEDITGQIQKKVEAAYLYKSQLRESGPLSPKALEIWAASCGFECGSSFAERFEVFRSFR
jgi:LmbE family N-acetylglucosaminyl deacetylase